MRLGFISVLLCISFQAFTQRPVITNFSPLKGDVGSIVTINGTGFDISGSNCLVFFGDVQASVQSKTTTQLTVLVPSGARYAPITVINTSRFNSTSSSISFTPTFSLARHSTVMNFSGLYDIPIPSKPLNAAVGDLDNDGKLDIVVVNENSDAISIARNIGTAGNFSFASNIDYTVGRNPQSVSIGDINSDGKFDLVVTNLNDNSVTVLKNTSTIGAISFINAGTFRTNNSPVFVAIGDLDNDGRPDLIVANYLGHNISVLRNNSASNNIAFDYAIDINAGNKPVSIALNDFDGDKSLDIAVANLDDNVILLYRNLSTLGNINLADPYRIQTWNMPHSVVAGDVDGDEMPDLAVASEGGISIFRNVSISGSFNFSSKKDFTSGTNPLNLAFGDLNGDGKPDLVTINNTGNRVSTYKNASYIGNIEFEPSYDFTPDTESSNALSVGDFNNDGKPEILAGNYNANKISIVKNNSSFVFTIFPPKINSFLPLSGKAGTILTINGSGFSSSIDSNAVYFGNVKSKIIAVDSVQIKVIVPIGATYSSITVTNLNTSFSNVSHSRFNPIFSPNKASLTYKDFEPATTFTTGLDAQNLRSGDMDGDGKLDILFVNSNVEEPSISILLNKSVVDTLKFESKIDINVGSGPIDLDIADLNNDGKLDIVIIDDINNSLILLKNTSTLGKISFETTKIFDIFFKPNAIAIGDLDNDGRLDITVSTSDNIISIFRNKGNFTFDSKSDLFTYKNPTKLILGDINGDMKLDIITANIGESISVYKNNLINGKISFLYDYDFTTGKNPVDISIADLNGDGKLDIVTVNNTFNAFYGSNNTITILKNISNNGSIQFNPKIDYKVELYPKRVSIGDLNGDGKPDISVANSGDLGIVRFGSILMFKNIGDSSIIKFDNAQNLRGYGFYNSVVNADMDGDGKLDIAAILGVGNLMAVHRNIATFPPEIISFFPKNGLAGSELEITGVNFSENISDNIVYFGTIRGFVKSSTTNSIKVIVPNGASYGSIIVLNNKNGLQGISKLHFTPKFSPPKNALDLNHFLPKKDFKIGSISGVIKTGDFDGDGKVDIVSANYFNHSISIFRNSSNDGIANFENNIDFETGERPQAIAIADLNSDSKLDIAVVDALDNTVSIFINYSNGIGNIKFVNVLKLQTGSNPNDIGVQDFDLDGKLDIVVLNNIENTFSVYINTDSYNKLNYAPRVNYNTNADSKNLSIGDINNDGYFDIVISSQAAQLVSVYFNNQFGEFKNKEDYNTGKFPTTASLSDINEDGKLDLVVGHKFSSGEFGDDKIAILMNNNGKFSNQKDYGTGVFPNSIAFGDIDGDGKVDLGVSGQTSGTISIFKNISTVSNIDFSKKLDIPTVSMPFSLNMVDIDGDSRVDLLSTSANIFITPVVSFIKNVYPLIIYANNQSICINKTELNQNFSVIGLLNGHDISSIKLTSNGISTTAPIGTYPIVPSNAIGIGLNNYKINYVNGVLTKEAPIPGKRLDPIDASLIINNKVQLNARNLGITGTQYSWTPYYNLNNSTISNPIATLDKQEEYKIEMKTPSGCVTVDTLLTRVHKEQSIYVPNAFSPNGDGVNDVLKVKLIGFKQLNNFVIRNPIGWVLFNTNDVNRGWNGYSWYKLAAGTYYWYVSATDMNGQTVQKSGSVLMLK